MNTQGKNDQEYVRLLNKVVEIVREAGKVLAQRFSLDARPSDLAEILEALHGNDDAVQAKLQPDLMGLRPGVRWAEDELAAGALGPGEWWVVDPSEGNINHVHGLRTWAVSATLVEENRPVLTVVYQPLTDDLFTAATGCGARQGDKELRISGKASLDAALVGTGQASPKDDEQTHRRTGESIRAMLDSALVVQSSVPATLTLIDVAAGRMDAFWQYSQVGSGLLAGALLVTEAGGMVTDLRGEAWDLTSKDFLAAAPGVHASTVAVLSTIQ